MKPQIVLSVLALLLGMASVKPNASWAAETPAKAGKPALYDTKADGNAQIAAALKTVKAENKRIILKFGANW